MKFKEDLLWESQVKHSIMQKVVNTTKTEFDRWATLEEEKTSHFDFYLVNGQRVEIKARRYEAAKKKGYFDKDIAIETKSCKEKETPGWIYTTKADYLAYAFVDKTGQIRRYYLFYFPELQKWWKDQGRFNNYETRYGKTGKLYTTENKVVPINEIPLDFFFYHPQYGVLAYSTGDTNYKIE